MRYLKFFVILLIGFSIIGCTAKEKDTLPRAMYDRLAPGWNLGGNLDAVKNGISYEGAWSNKDIAGQAFFDTIASYGVKSVRIPVTWLGHVGPAPEYVIDSSWMARVRQVVEYGEKANLNVIINIMHDDHPKFSEPWLDMAKAANSEAFNDSVKCRLRAMWIQIADAFKDKGDFLIFEPFNEVQDGNWGRGLKDGDRQFEVINEWNQVFVDAVRSTGGNNAERYLSVVSYGALINTAVKNLKLPEDTAKDKLLVAVHYYNPTDFTLETTVDEWGHTRTTNIGNHQYNEVFLISQLDKLKDKFIDKGIPVYIGEMGCCYRGRDTGERYRKYFMEYFVKAANDRDITCFVWDNGRRIPGKECHAYFNHNTGDTFYDGVEMIKTIVKAATCRDLSYTLESVYKSAPNN